MKKKSLLFSLIAVLVICLIVAGSTFAYFQWTTAEDQRTNVNVVIETGGIEMVISPETTTFTGLRPVDPGNCHTSSAVGKATITIKNKTGTLAIPSFKLKVKVVDKNGNGVSEDVLEHIHYSVVKNSYVTSETVSYEACFYGELMSYDYYESLGYSRLFNYNGEPAVRGSFSGISENGEWSVLPGGGYLPREFYTTTDGTNLVDGITFIGEKKKPDEDVTETTETFAVIVWIDSDYVATNVGNVISDPLQDATIYVTWSEDSMIQQVAGAVKPGDRAVSGTWKWNDEMVSKDIKQEVNFTYERFESTISAHTIELSFGTCSVNYYSDVFPIPGHNFYCWDYDDGTWHWGGTDGRIINFGTTPQNVSQEFYDYLIANATKVS